MALPMFGESRNHGPDYTPTLETSEAPWKREKGVRVTGALPFPVNTGRQAVSSDDTCTMA